MARDRRTEMETVGESVSSLPRLSLPDSLMQFTVYI